MKVRVNKDEYLAKLEARLATLTKERAARGKAYAIKLAKWRDRLFDWTCRHAAERSAVVPVYHNSFSEEVFFRGAPRPPTAPNTGAANNTYSRVEGAIHALRFSRQKSVMVDSDEASKWFGSPVESE